MGLAARTISNIAEARARVSTIGPPRSISDLMLRLLGGGSRSDTAAGVDVNQTTALTYSALWAAVRLISETKASTPFPLYRRLESGGKDKATDDDRFWMAGHSPNPEMTAYQYREAGTMHQATWGNAYSEIEFEGAKPKRLWPLHPSRVDPMRTNDTNELFYAVTLRSGERKAIPARNMLHIPWVTTDGIVGYSPIDLARESIALGLALQKYGATFFKNDARPGGVLTHPKTLSEPAALRLEQDMERRRELSQKHRLQLLEEGMKFEAIGIPPENAQFLETRTFEVGEIARWYNIQLHKLQEMSAATFSNIEEQSMEFVRDTMNPWYKRDQQGYGAKLLLPSEMRKMFWEFNLDDSLRADIKTRFESYALGRTHGWLNADEVRAKENMNPLPDEKGQVFLQQSNMIEAGSPPPDAIRTLAPILLDALMRIEGREKRDGPKLDINKHRAFMSQVMSPYQKLHRQVMGEDFSIKDFIDDRIKKLEV